jgi:hypothetical protein
MAPMQLRSRQCERLLIVGDTRQAGTTLGTKTVAPRSSKLCSECLAKTSQATTMRPLPAKEQLIPA